MLFSIIIPVYNVENYLRDCLDSVLNQSFNDWEAICVDDGSTDHSRVVLNEFAAKDKRVRVLSQSNAGTAAARNTGLKEAKGEYIFFLDSDDWIESNALQTLAAKLNGEDILCFSGRRFIESTETFNPADILIEKTYQNGMDYYNENALLTRDFAFVCVVLRVYERTFLLRNGLYFDDNISFEDNLWVPITLYYANKVSVIQDNLYVYRIRKGSKMQDLSLKRKIDVLRVANQLSEFFIPKKDFDTKIVYQAITHHYQKSFVNASITEDKVLLPIVNWSFYKTVSRTKPRQRLFYYTIRISPRLFRLIFRVFF